MISRSATRPGYLAPLERTAPLSAAAYGHGAGVSGARFALNVAERHMVV